jgi:hypothetical protein
VIVRAHIDYAIGYRQGEGYILTYTVGPEGLTAAMTRGIKGIKLVIIRANINHSIGSRRGGGDTITSLLGS